MRRIITAFIALTVLPALTGGGDPGRAGGGVMAGLAGWRWPRVVAWSLAGLTALVLALPLQKSKVGGVTGALRAAGVAAYPNPLGVFPEHEVFWMLFLLIAAIGFVTAVLVVRSVFVRRRSASFVLRQQLAWLAYVGVLTTVLFGLLIATFLWGPGNELAATVILVLLVLTPLVGIPVACAMAVLKYRLYDLDIIVRKTVVAGLVAAAFTAIYAVVVAGVGVVTGHAGSSALTFAAAALAAVALQPVRAWAKLLAGRLVYGRRATPYEVLSQSACRRETPAAEALAMILPPRLTAVLVIFSCQQC